MFTDKKVCGVFLHRNILIHIWQFFFFFEKFRQTFCWHNRTFVWTCRDEKVTALYCVCVCMCPCRQYVLCVNVVFYARVRWIFCGLCHFHESFILYIAHTFKLFHLLIFIWFVCEAVLLTLAILSRFKYSMPFRNEIEFVEFNKFVQSMLLNIILHLTLGQCRTLSADLLSVNFLDPDARQQFPTPHFPYSGRCV